MSLRKALTQMTAPLRRTRNTPPPAAAPAALLEGAGHAGSATLAQQILAHLLLELPDHHRAFTAALQDNDYAALGHCAHKLAGAVAYCELPALAAALGDLRQALGTDDADHIRQACHAATGCMHALMVQSGARLP